MQLKKNKFWEFRGKLKWGKWFLGQSVFPDRLGISSRHQTRVLNFQAVKGIMRERFAYKKESKNEISTVFQNSSHWKIL